MKSLNFLLASDLTVKICDFEHSIRSNPGVQASRATGPFVSPWASVDAEAMEDYARRVGNATQNGRRKLDTLNWMAPECVRAQLLTKASDVYSLGVVLWEIFTGTCNFFVVGHACVRLLSAASNGGSSHPQGAFLSMDFASGR